MNISQLKLRSGKFVVVVVDDDDDSDDNDDDYDDDDDDDDNNNNNNNNNNEPFELQQENSLLHFTTVKDLLVLILRTL